MPSKNRKTLVNFVKYCEKHPEERFWQALRNWSLSSKIIRAWFDEKGIANREDTFYKE